MNKMCECGQTISQKAKRCQRCARAFYRKNRRTNHREEHLAEKKRHRQKHKEQRLQYDAKRRAENKDIINQKRRENPYKLNAEQKVKASLARKQNKIRKKQQLTQYLQERECSICGFKDVDCLCFHHRDPLQKEYCVAVMIARNRSWECILEEIAKCDILCMNCHTKLHKPK